MPGDDERLRARRCGRRSGVARLCSGDEWNGKSKSGDGGDAHDCLHGRTPVRFGCTESGLGADDQRRMARFTAAYWSRIKLSVMPAM